MNSEFQLETPNTVVLQTSDMWSKIFLAALGLSIAIVAFFSYYSWSWLQSIGDPKAAVAGFEYHSGLAWPILWISSIILLALANAVLWITGRGWAMWLTFLYFAAFVVLRFFWLTNLDLSYRKLNGLADTTYSLGPFIGAVMIIVVGAIVFFDQFLVLRMHRKMYPSQPEAAGPSDEQ